MRLCRKEKNPKRWADSSIAQCWIQSTATRAVPLNYACFLCCRKFRAKIGLIIHLGTNRSTSTVRTTIKLAILSNERRTKIIIVLVKTFCSRSLLKTARYQLYCILLCIKLLSSYLLFVWSCERFASVWGTDI